MDVSLYQRLDEQISSFSDNFSNMVRSALIEEEDDDLGKSSSSFAPGKLPDIFAAKMLHNAQTALNLVSELKKASMHSDVTALTLNSREVKTVLEQEVELGDRHLSHIKKEAQRLLEKIETHYYGSVASKPREEEREMNAWELLFADKEPQKPE